MSCTANPIRPSAEIVPAANGSATEATWSRRLTSLSTAATSSRRPSSVPCSASKTTSALPLAASGKFWLSSCKARSLWLPGDEKSSVNVPPPLAARKKTAPRTRTQLVMVRHGCLALAAEMPRVNLSMILPFEGAWVVLMDGS